MARSRKLLQLNFLLLVALLASYLLACSPPAQPPAPSPTVAESTAKPKALTAQPTQPGKAPTVAPTVVKPPSKPKALTVAEIAMLDLNPERQKTLEAGARDEGELMLYTTQTGLEQTVAAAFMRRYPFIKMEVFQSNTPSLIERTRAELTARRLGGDVFNGGLRSFMPLVDFFAPFKSPGANFSVHPKGSVSNVTLIVFVYNTRLVPPNEVPQKLEDLLLPRWKGKIGFHGPPNTFPGIFTGTLLEMNGEEQTTSFLKKLGEQNLFLYQTGGVGMQAIISGEVHIGTQSTSSAVEAKESKSPVNWVALDPTAATVTLSGLFGKAAHPYSAMLWLDWLSGPEGQKVLNEEANYLPMRDVERGEVWGIKLPKRIRLESPDDEKNVRKWNDKFSELVGRKK